MTSLPTKNTCGLIVDDTRLWKDAYHHQPVNNTNTHANSSETIHKTLSRHNRSILRRNRTFEDDMKVLVGHYPLGEYDANSNTLYIPRAAEIPMVLWPSDLCKCTENTDMDVETTKTSTTITNNSVECVHQPKKTIRKKKGIKKTRDTNIKDDVILPNSDPLLDKIRRVSQLTYDYGGKLPASEYAANNNNNNNNKTYSSSSHSFRSSVVFTEEECMEIFERFVWPSMCNKRCMWHHGTFQCPPVPIPEQPLPVIRSMHPSKSIMAWTVLGVCCSFECALAYILAVKSEVQGWLTRQRIHTLEQWYVHSGGKLPLNPAPDWRLQDVYSSRYACNTQLIPHDRFREVTIKANILFNEPPEPLVPSVRRHELEHITRTSETETFKNSRQYTKMLRLSAIDTYKHLRDGGNNNNNNNNSNNNSNNSGDSDDANKRSASLNTSPDNVHGGSVATAAAVTVTVTPNNTNTTSTSGVTTSMTRTPPNSPNPSSSPMLRDITIDNNTCIHVSHEHHEQHEQQKRSVSKKHKRKKKHRRHKHKGSNTKIKRIKL